MELFELSDDSFPPVTITPLSSDDFFLQEPETRVHFVDGTGWGEAYEVIQSGNPPLLQVVEPAPQVSYLMKADGSLLPVQDSRIPVVDNAVTIITGAEDPDVDSRVPSHILDHMYARKYKEPGTGVPPRPRKRVRRREESAAAPNREIALPEMMAPSSPKVNIIRKGVSTASASATRPPLISSQPKAPQYTRAEIVAMQKEMLKRAMNDFLKIEESTGITEFVSARVISMPQVERHEVNLGTGRNNIENIEANTGATNSAASGKGNGSSSASATTAKLAKPSFIMTTKNPQIASTSSCVALPSKNCTATSSSAASPTPSTSTKVERVMECRSRTGTVSTFRINDDGTVTLIPSRPEPEESSPEVVDNDTEEDEYEEDQNEEEEEENNEDKNEEDNNEEGKNEEEENIEDKNEESKEEEDKGEEEDKDQSDKLEMCAQVYYLQEKE